GGAPVIERRLAHQLDLHMALEVLDDAYQRVLGVLVGRGTRVWRDVVLSVARSHRQRLANRRPSGWRLPRGDQRVGARLVDPAAGHVDPEWPHTKRPRAAVEQRAEDAGRVESRDAQPVD